MYLAKLVNLYRLCRFQKAVVQFVVSHVVRVGVVEQSVSDQPESVLERQEPDQELTRHQLELRVSCLVKGRMLAAI